ncbi:MAG TPA: hypothetical protein VMH22_14945 [bacterium]|nr:hypothetical protein [bacterium]
MKTMTLLLVAGLCLVALAAGGAAVAPKHATSYKSQATTLGTESITIPQMLSYQGKLTDTLGAPVSDTTYQVTFRLYTVATGGASFWNETQTVRTRSGLFATLLGSVAPIESVPSSGNLYLGMAVAGGTQLSPRLRLVGSAYSYLAGKSANSDLLQGKDTTGFVRTNQANSVTGAMIFDGAVTSADIRDTTVNTADIKDAAVTAPKLNQMGATSNQVLKWNGSAWAPRNDSIGGGGGDSAWVRGTPDSVLYTVHRLGIARGGASNMLYGTYRQSHVNFGVACTTGVSGSDYAHVVVSGGYANRAFADHTTVGGGGNNTAESSFSTVSGGGNNTAVHGYAVVGGGQNNTAVGIHSAVLGGSGNYAAGAGSSIGGGDSNTTSDDDATVVGGYGNVASYACATVSGGRSNHATDVNTSIGGGAENAAGSAGATVSGGYANSASGVYATVAGGDYDTSAASESFTANGSSKVPYAHGNSAAFNGEVTTASNQTRVGIISKAGGSFTIDDPVDPSGTILNHYFIEGPEMRNLYDGEAVLDASGRAVVTLPAYFDALNRNPRVQLTGVGSSDVYVAQEVVGNQFTIGGKAGTKIFWQVTGERKDVSAEAIRRMMPVEQPKTGPLAGRMLDDDFLAGCMDQLVREGKTQGIDFRTAAGRAKYEKMKQMLEHPPEHPLEHPLENPQR